MFSSKTQQPADLVRQCIHDLARIFQENPFQFSSEKHLHRTFAELFRSKDPESEFDLQIEYPVPVSGTEYGRGRVMRNRDAHIDITFTQHGATQPVLLGIEMGWGKGHDEGQVQIGDHSYAIPESSISPQEAMGHLERDVWKLCKETPNNYLLVYFFSHSFNERAGVGRLARRAKKIKEVTDLLRSYKGVDQDRLIFVESLFLNGKATSRHALNLPELDSNLP